MEHAGVRRRRLLGMVAASSATVSLAACSGLAQTFPRLADQSSRTATRAGSATPSSTFHQWATPYSATAAPVATPENVPGAVAAAYLAAWNAGRYADMYDLISADAQGRISKDAFVQRYGNIAAQATITKVDARLLPGQRQGANIQHFAVTFDTVLVGTIQEQNTITLGVAADSQGWKVQWLPSLIFKELTGDDLIHMYPLGAPRGDILDHAGKPRATAGKVATVYLTPAGIKDEPAMLSQLGALLAMSQAVIMQK